MELAEPTKRPRGLLRRAAHAGKSIVKTSILRRGRRTKEEIEDVLSVCHRCPGGHAVFKDNGELHTCGPMLDTSGGGCGCVLEKKARDEAEDCPHSYWPRLVRLTVLKG